MKNLIVLLILFPFVTVAKDAAKSYQIHYGFIENKGQITDQNYKLNPAVKYLWKGGNLLLQLKQNSFSYEVLKIERSARKETSEESTTAARHSKEDVTVHSHRVDIELVGANIDPEIIPEGKSSDYLNYYTPSTPVDGITFVHHYNKATYKDIYPNIDLEFVINNENKRESSIHPFKYNFIVRPGGNIADIRLRYYGARSILLENDVITISTSNGSFNESIPLSYIHETGKKVHVSYKDLGNDTYGYTTSELTVGQTLVIDPWATYFGGSSDYIAGNDVATDAFGNIAIAGNVALGGFASAGAFQVVYNGQGDGFIAKFNSSGSAVWATMYGGYLVDELYGVTFDHGGNMIACGLVSNSPAFLITLTQGMPLNEGPCVIKFDSTGIRQWATYVDDNGSCSDVVCDGASEIFVGGHYAWSSVLKLHANGYIDSNYIQSDSANEHVRCIAIDPVGNIVVAGYAGASLGVTPGAHQITFGGGWRDGFITKYNATGTKMWGTYYGGNNNDIIYGVSVDQNGNIAAMGETESSNNIASAGSHQPVKGDSTDAFITMFTSGGTRLWGTYYGGSGNEEGRGVAIDATQHIIAVGTTTSFTNIASPGAYQTSRWGYNDGFIVKFDQSGNRIWGTYLGGNKYEFLHDVATDVSSNIIVTGYTFSDTGIATPNAWQQYEGYGYQESGLLVSFNSEGNFNAIPNINQIGYNQTICSGVQPALIAGSISDPGVQYLWLQSTLGTSSGFIPASGINNLQHYQPPTLTANTWYKRVVTDGSASDTSGPVAITVASPFVTVVSASDTTICTGDGVILNSSGGANYFHQWLLNGTVITNATDSHFYATTAGAFQLIDIDTNNCVDTSTAITMSELPKPDAYINWIGAPDLCAGDSLTFQTADSLNYTYQWTFNGVAIVGATNSFYQALGGGLYEVIVHSNNGCDSIPYPAYVDTSISFVIAISNSNGTLAPGNSYATYQWYLNGNAIAGATNQTYIATQNGDYYLVATNSNACTSTSNILSVTITDVREPERGDIYIIPNPVTDKASIKTRGSFSQRGIVYVYDNIGRVLLQRPINHTETLLDLSAFSAGYYLVRYQAVDGTFITAPFVKL